MKGPSIILTKGEDDGYEWISCDHCGKHIDGDVYGVGVDLCKKCQDLFRYEFDYLHGDGRASRVWYNVDEDGNVAVQGVDGPPVDHDQALAAAKNNWESLNEGGKV